MGDHEPIKRQQQPDEISCVCTSIAMILDRPVQEIIVEYHDDYMDGTKKVEDYLAEQGVKATPMLTTDWSDKEGDLFLIAAPSLNIVAATHELILDWRDVNAGAIVIDPNAGKEGKKYYVNKWPEDLKENEVNMKGYFFDYRICPT